MKPLRIKCVDFWSDDFDFSFLSPFSDILPQLYDVQIVEECPDVLFYSVFGNKHLKYDNDEITKILYSAEVRSDYKERHFFQDCDYSFSYHYREGDPNHYRLPNWVVWRYNRLNELTELRDGDQILEEKSNFCNFLYSNSNPEERKDFFNQLSEYKHVDSGGSVLNNIDYEIPQGQDIQWTSNYKFNIAFENASYEGYTTEKLYRAFLAKTIPIYWGNPYVHEDFNSDSFIWVKDTDNFDKAIERVKELDQDDEKYKKMVSQPPFRHNKIPLQWQEDVLKDYFKEIFG